MSGLQWVQRNILNFVFVWFLTVKLGTSLSAAPYISEWKSKGNLSSLNFQIFIPTLIIASIDLL